jgi:two-component system chemotaxis sensor kinase CheA
MTEIDREAIVQTFLLETEEHLGQMEEALVALESHRDDEDAVQTIFRIVHTLKGNSVSLDLTQVARFAHVLEDLLDRLRTHALAVTPALVTLLLRSVDAIRSVLPEELSGVTSLRAEHEALLAELSSWLSGEGMDAAAPIAPGPLTQSAGQGLGTLRVAISRLDRMLDLSGEIAIARGRLGQMLASAGLAPSLEAHKDMDRLFLDLQEQLLAARMVPVGPTFRQQARTVRDVALKHGKRVALVLEGEDVEVDTTVIEQVRAPLMHLVRNAIDHGIEPAEVRVARGKSPEGRLRLRAFHETGHIVIELSDDGGGLDRAKILERGRERGLIRTDAPLSDDEIDRLIFEPGFTTADGVTDLSGRGIGMDVVRKNIEALRGTIVVTSHPGVGTTVTMRLPLTLAIIQGFLVGVGGETYVIPLDAVLECVDLPAPAADPGAETGVITLRGQPVPYLRLRAALGVGGRPTQREAIVVIRHKDGRAGLAVDTLRGEAQAVIKPLGEPFGTIPGVAGSTILGDGRVSLILDAVGLVESAIVSSRGSWGGSNLRSAGEADRGQRPSGRADRTSFEGARAC